MALAEEKITFDHKEIKNWVEKFNGWPVIFQEPTAGQARAGLRIDFPDSVKKVPGDLTIISRKVGWREFFRLFEERELAFSYQEKPSSNDMTWAYRFIPRESLLEEENSEEKAEST